MAQYKLGQTIETNDGRQGIIRFIGTGSFASGEWIGVELPDNSGKNDGSVKGERYFQCEPGHGLFIRKEAISGIVKQAPQPATRAEPTKLTNGAMTRPRPSSGITPDVARKRQSLMSSGSGAGSRLSVRSPTKAAHSSASSATSTPRTGTPATTNRTSDSSAKSRLSINGRPSMGPPVAKSATRVSRPSVGGAAKTVSRPTTSQPRASLGGPKIQTQPAPHRTLKPTEDTVKEEEDDAISSQLSGEQTPIAQADGESAGDAGQPSDTQPERTQQNGGAGQSSQSLSRTGRVVPGPTMNGSMESRATTQRENESLKAKLRIMEKKRQEDREKFKVMEDLQADKDRFENIIQALQKKLKASQHELGELRKQYAELEARASNVDDRTAEHESEIELITLDKEMAEERAETFRAELEALKLKHEELELETEIIREENRELGSVMSPEERASAGWLQMERERDRLREALVLLRDVTQQNETDLKAQVKELQDDLNSAEELASKLQETSERLSRSEATNKYLKEQLEAAESNEEVTMALEQEKETHLGEIQALKQQIQDLQDEVQINAELEEFHITAEKELQAQLDETQAMLQERQQLTIEQERSIQDLEYTLVKFREVVSGLQNDIDELRRSRDISEAEAHEMSSKSRAMMDLNLQLQNSAAKSQMKAIDVELGRIRADESTKHLNILQMFISENFEGEKGPILAFLCFRRMKSKALLVSSLLKDRIRDRPHLTADEPFVPFEVVEKLARISGLCEMFAKFLSSCDVESFARMNGALYELEPVEKAIDSWIQALRQDEMGTEGSAHLERMVGILEDLAEKFIDEDMETKNTELVMEASLVESYCDSITGQIGTVVKIVQSRLGTPTDENEESIHFDKKMDHFMSKSRTIRFVAAKTRQGLEEMQSRSMGLGEASWKVFTDAVDSARVISQTVHAVGKAVVDAITEEDTEQPLSYAATADIMTKAISLASSSGASDDKIDAFNIMTSKLQHLQSKVDDMQLKSQDLSLASEFERRAQPWTVRANAIKSQKVISPDVQEELTKLKTKLQDQLTAIASKDRQLEEQQIKIELLESRTKETKIHSEAFQKIEHELSAMRKAKEQLEQDAERARSEYELLKTEHETHVIELETLRKTGVLSGVVGSTTTDPALDTKALFELQAQNAVQQTEIEDLQAAVRWLKREAYHAKLSVSDFQLQAKQVESVHPSTLRVKAANARAEAARNVKVKEQADDVFNGLFGLHHNVSPIVLHAHPPPALKPQQPTSGNENTGGNYAKRKSSSWRPMKDNPTYQVLRQREDLENWQATRNDLVRKIRLAWGYRGGHSHPGIGGGGGLTRWKPQHQNQPIQIQ